MTDLVGCFDFLPEEVFLAQDPHELPTSTAVSVVGVDHRRTADVVAKQDLRL